MPRAHANRLDFEYDSFGDPNAAPLVLIMGLGAQMTSWDPEFCELLAAKGFHVTRFDNRDIGLSSKLDRLGQVNPLAVAQGQAQAPYSLDDMADDTAALMDALGISAAHIVGASMGGFIGQLLVLRHPRRALSLTSIMSAPGGLADNDPATPAATEALLTPPPQERAARVDHSVWLGSRICGPLFDEAEARRRAEAAVDRSVSDAGAQRQFAAIAAAPNREEALNGVRVPTLVIHGEADPLVPVSNGRRTAAAIPGARLVTFSQMGHNLPKVYWAEMAEAIAETARQAAGSAPA